jgi:hypothetical protein
MGSPMKKSGKRKRREAMARDRAAIQAARPDEWIVGVSQEALEIERGKEVRDERGRDNDGVAGPRR